MTTKPWPPTETKYISLLVNQYSFLCLTSLCAIIHRYHGVHVGLKYSYESPYCFNYILSVTNWQFIDLLSAMKTIRLCLNSKHQSYERAS